MKKYKLSSKLSFPKYEGYTIEEIIKIDAQYIEWCIENLEHMLVSESVIKELENHIDITPKLKEILAKKEEDYRRELRAKERQDNNDYYSNSYRNYDAFNDAFEGDIDAWNHYNQ